MKKDRLRVLDINITWFGWITIFYNHRNYGKPTIELLLWKAHDWSSWFHFWEWENFPDERGAFAVPKTEVGATV